MIDKAYGKYIPSCDGCGDDLGDYDSFDDARDAIKANGWETRRYGTDWVDYCPSCAPKDVTP